MNFENKCFWITGASSGMGKALALLLGDYHVHLILSDRNFEGLTDVVNEIEIKGSKATPVQLDMSDTSAIRLKTEEIIAKVGKIDGLYQFAGISQRSLVTETPDVNDRKIMEVNFFGAVTLVKCLLPSMISNGGGQLAVTSSLVGKFGFPYRSAYSASKHALHGYFESLRAENSAFNIKVSILIPGRIQTNISRFALTSDGNEYGKMDPGQANGITAEKAARQILAGLKKEKKEVHVGGKELLMLYFRRFVPSLFYFISSRIKPV